MGVKLFGLRPSEVTEVTDSSLIEILQLHGRILVASQVRSMLYCLVVSNPVQLCSVPVGNCMP